MFERSTLVVIFLLLAPDLLQAVDGQTDGPKKPLLKCFDRKRIEHFFGSKKPGSDFSPTDSDNEASQAANKQPLAQSAKPQAQKDLLSAASRFGLPSQDFEIGDNYIFSVDRRLKRTNWIFQHLTPDSIRSLRASAGESPRFRFLPRCFQFTDDGDKEGAPNRDHVTRVHDPTEEAESRPYRMLNSCPQTEDLHLGPWTKLEDYVDHLAVSSKNMYVFSGPTYKQTKKEDGKTGIHDVTTANKNFVPSHFYAVWIREDRKGALSIEGFMLPNTKLDEETPLDQYRVDGGLKTLKQATGFDFFRKLKRRPFSKVLKPTTLQLNWPNHMSSSPDDSPKTKLPPINREEHDRSEIGEAPGNESPRINSRGDFVNNIASAKNSVRLTGYKMPFIKSTQDVNAKPKVPGRQTTMELVQQLQREQRSMYENLFRELLSIKQSQNDDNKRIFSYLDSLEQSVRGWHPREEKSEAARTHVIGPAAHRASDDLDSDLDSVNDTDEHNGDVYSWTDFKSLFMGPPKG